MSIIIKSELTSSLDAVDVGKVNIFLDTSDNNVKFKKSDGTINFFAAASASNTGTGITVFSGSTGTANFVFKSLQGVDGISITENTGTIYISSSITATNLGTGSPVYSGSSLQAGFQQFNFFTLSGSGGITITNSGSFVIISSSVTTHAQNHIRSGSDEIDGDKLDIDYSASNYTPTITGSLTTSTEELTSHLNGINNRLGDLMALNISSSAATAFTVSSNDIRKYIRFTASSAITCSVSTSHGYSTGHTTIFVAAGTGQIMFGSGSGVTINHPGSGSNPRTRTRFSSMMLTCISENTFDLTGDVTTS